MKYCINASAATRLIICVATLATISVSVQIPSDKKKLDSWFSQNVKPLSSRKGTLDPALVAAESNMTVIKVKAGGGGDFKTITEAIASVPAGNTNRVVISIAGGVYKEKVIIPRTKPFITLYGSPTNMPNLTFDGNAKKYGTVYSGTLTVDSDYFVAANLVIVNTNPRPSPAGKQEQALAARIFGTKAAIYNCRFHGYQDTLCDDTGVHLFKDCYIEGLVDFIFGRGQSLYLNTELKVLGDGGMAVITAQAKDNAADTSGYSFVHCRITGTGGPGSYLGRAWMSRSTAIFSYTTIEDVIHPLGWNNMHHPNYDATVNYGEYQCSGPGSNATGRVKYGKQLTEAEVKPFLTLDFIKADKWLLPPPTPETCSA